MERGKRTDDEEDAAVLAPPRCAAGTAAAEADVLFLLAPPPPPPPLEGENEATVPSRRKGTEAAGPEYAEAAGPGRPLQRPGLEGPVSTERGEDVFCGDEYLPAPMFEGRKITLAAVAAVAGTEEAGCIPRDDARASTERAATALRGDKIRSGVSARR